ncbi:hypothetical protein SBRCBS47491_006635 [Sporothrix bragantina]|uniref:CCT domain-containing protein n=1 Tax=Sporothrix bragantina TaxID=671064 RepID=A0ABP0C7W0_9PEZI
MSGSKGLSLLDTEDNSNPHGFDRQELMSIAAQALALMPVFQDSESSSTNIESSATLNEDNNSSEPHATAKVPYETAKATAYMKRFKEKRASYKAQLERWNADPARCVKKRFSKLNDVA